MGRQVIALESLILTYNNLLMKSMQVELNAYEEQLSVQLAATLQRISRLTEIHAQQLIQNFQEGTNDQECPEE